MVAEVGQPVRPGAHEAIVQKSFAVPGVGLWRDRREVHRCEQARQRCGWPGELQHHPIGLRCFHRLDAATDHIAQAPDLQKTPEAEGHGLSIEFGSVMKPNPPAQGNRDC